MDETLERLCSWVDAHREEIVADILKSVSLYSPSEDRAAVSECLAWFKRKALSLGFESSLRAGGEVLSVRAGMGGRSVGLIAHADVVPIGEPGQWTRDPRGLRENGRIYGRGVLDDKGMAVVCLWCMKAVQENVASSWALETIIGSREEIEWTDIALYKREGWRLPDYSFTPDGNFPLCNREKGYCDVAFLFRRQGDDPAALTFIRGAAATNSVPGLARAEYTGGEMTARGKEVHSSIPEQGENALIKLLAMLEEAGVSRNGFGELYRFSREKLARSHDGADSLFLKRHPGVRDGEEMGYTTAVPTMASLQGDELRLNVNLRTVYGTTRKELEEGFARVCAEYGCRYEITDYQDPLYVPANLPIIQAMSRAYELRTGQTAAPELAAGTSYAKAFPNCVSFGPVFPGREDYSHMPDEYITEEDLFESMKIYLISLALFLRERED